MNMKAQIAISNGDCGIAKCDTFKAASGASLKDSGRRGFAFLKVERERTIFDADREQMHKKMNILCTL